jgi:anti-sigma-K factor RskA
VTAPGEQRGRIVVAFLLGELEPAERERFERDLTEDAELRAEVEAMQPVVSRLEGLPDDAWEPPEPPPLALPVAEIPAAAAPAVPWWRRRPARLALAAGLACAALIAGLAIGLGALDGDGGDGGLEGDTVALDPVGPRQGGAAGELTLPSAADEQARLRVSGLSPSGDDFYEVWLLGKRGVVSLGSFRVGEGGGTDLDLRLPVDTSGYRYYDVSLEPDDGDPEHSGDSILRGPTAS